MASKTLPLPVALLWIVGSTFAITGSAYSFLTHYRASDRKHREEPCVSKIVQTGPHTDILKTDYLAEIMGLSRDHPAAISTFDLHQATRQLLQMPMIKEAHVSVIRPDTVYVDYTMRQPMAMLYDYDNIAVDEEGFLFPFSPFFSPKALPELYFGKEISHQDEELFKLPMEGRGWILATRILKLLRQAMHDHTLSIERIDVSHAFEKSLGRQEIVIDLVYEEGETVRCVHHLRLHPQDYEQQLGNYFVLYEEMLGAQEMAIEEKVIDLRMEGIALISNQGQI